jgi:YqaJ-like viral recombinase domain
MLTEAQREKRKAYIGSSDLPTIAGADPFRNIADLYLEKRGLLEERAGDAHTRRGQRMEPVILDWFEERMSVTLAKDIWIDDGESFCANLDGAILADGETYNGDPSEIVSPVEAKSTKWIELWGEEVSDVPVPVIVQVSWQMFLAGKQCRRAFAPVLWPKFRDFGFVIPPVILRDDELIEELELAARDFLDCVRTGRQPEDVTPHLESLKRVKREPETVLSLDAEQSLEIEAYWNGGRYCEECGWFGHQKRLIKEERCPNCGAAPCRPRSRQHYKDKENSARADSEAFHAKVVSMLGAAEAARLIDGAMFTYSSVRSARQTDEDLLQHKLASLQDCIVRAAEQIKSGAPGEALSVLSSLDAEAIYDAVVSQGSHRRLFFKKAPKVKVRRARR